MLLVRLIAGCGPKHHSGDSRGGGLNKFPLFVPCFISVIADNCSPYPISPDDSKLDRAALRFSSGETVRCEGNESEGNGIRSLQYLEFFFFVCYYTDFFSSSNNSVSGRKTVMLDNELYQKPDILNSGLDWHVVHWNRIFVLVSDRTISVDLFLRQGDVTGLI